MLFVFYSVYIPWNVQVQHKLTPLKYYATIIISLLHNISMLASKRRITMYHHGYVQPQWLYGLFCSAQCQKILLKGNPLESVWLWWYIWPCNQKLCGPTSRSFHWHLQPFTTWSKVPNCFKKTCILSGSKKSKVTCLDRWHSCLLWWMIPGIGYDTNHILPQ